MRHPATLLAGVLCLALASHADAQRPKASQPSRVDPPTAALAPGGCPLPVYGWWRNHGGGGRIACGADPARPVVLLFHGLHQDAQTWTAPSHVEYAYDARRQPSDERIGSTHDKPNAGVYKVGASPWLYGADRGGWDRSVNWFDYLASLGFTVATWSQPGLSFADAWPSAREALDSIITHTAARSPASPPPVVLLGHSRGGLLIRKALKERGDGGGRVRMVITLHSPHQGSELGRAPGRIIAETVDLVDCCIPGELTAPVKDDVKNAVVELMRPFTKIFSAYENRELIPDGPLLRDLAQGEKPVAGVRYHTFGGTNPNYYRVYLWLFDATSAVPQYRNLTQYFVWRVKAAEIGPLSPIMEDLRDFVEEVRPGHGDGLVTNSSARLPWSVHTTTALNHAEVLWDRPLQRQVGTLIQGVAPAGSTRRSGPIP